MEILDSRFHGNDKIEKLDSHVPCFRKDGNEKMEGLQMEIMDSRFHGMTE